MNELTIISAILICLGIIGSIIPAMPGPFLSFLGILFLFFSENTDVSPLALVTFGIIMVLIIILDYVAPVMGAKYLGAGKKGIWGSVIGAFLGLIFFPPLGIFIGALVGAVVGEMASGKSFNDSMRAGAGAVLGSFSIMIFQIIYSISAAVYFLLKIL